MPNLRTLLLEEFLNLLSTNATRQIYQILRTEFLISVFAGTTVVYSGSAHSRFLFNELIVLEDYKIIEIENIKHILNTNYENVKRCEKVFPSFDTNIEELNNNYNKIKKMYDNEEIKDLKDNFIYNMLLMTSHRNIPVIPNIELTFGYWEDIMVNNPESLFVMNHPYY